VAQTDGYALIGGQILGGDVATVVVRDGLIVQVGGEVPGGIELRDVTGSCVGAGFIDSHVHLTYRPEAAAMREGGVVAAVDLAAPLHSLASSSSELALYAAGPMITAVGGYPTQSWGSAGYGLEVSGADMASQAVATLADGGAKLIKVSVTGPPSLTEAELLAVVEAAHGRTLKVVAHALGAGEVALAASVGVDALAHTPTAELSDETVAAWSNGAVISTLGAFGGLPTAVDNLRRLREAGATVLYGTDFGNSPTAGIDERELGLMADSGMDPASIRLAATEVPAAYWGFTEFGAVAVGKRGELWIGDCDCLWCDS
jgi:imidazolonepropionase-like amidohydrolase